MQENIRLLMEETGCEQGEAELALELAGQDLEKAIRTIGSLLRHICALKGKFCFPARNLYGLVLVMINTKTAEVLRLSSVVSYNPAVFENSPDMDWYSLEKLIFSCRLDEGSIPEFTQNIEERLGTHLRESRELLLRKPEGAEFSRIMDGFFSTERVDTLFVVEELNLAQFRQLPEGESQSSVKDMSSERDPGTVRLEVGLIEDKSGREARRLAEGDVILSMITDTRDIAHYLAHLIGSAHDGKTVPCPAVIRKVTAGDTESEIQVQYAPGIVGVARVDNALRVKIVEERNAPWWKKLIPWP